MNEALRSSARRTETYRIIRAYSAAAAVRRRYKVRPTARSKLSVEQHAPRGGSPDPAIPENNTSE